MGLFQKKQFKERPAESELPTDPASDSGLSKDGEKAVLALVLARNFAGLELAIQHPSSKVREYVVGFIDMAGRLEPTTSGGISFEIDGSGTAKGPLHPSALALLQKASKDPDASVRARAQACITQSKYF